MRKLRHLMRACPPVLQHHLDPPNIAVTVLFLSWVCCLLLALQLPRGGPLIKDPLLQAAGLVARTSSYSFTPDLWWEGILKEGQGSVPLEAQLSSHFTIKSIYEVLYSPLENSTKPEVRSPDFSAALSMNNLIITPLSFPHLVKRNLTYPTYFQNCCDDKMK